MNPFGRNGPSAADDRKMNARCPTQPMIRVFEYARVERFARLSVLRPEVMVMGDQGAGVEMPCEERGLIGIHIATGAIDAKRGERQLRGCNRAVNASVIFRVTRMKYAHASEIEQYADRIGNLPARHRDFMAGKDCRKLYAAQFDRLPSTERNDLRRAAAPTKAREPWRSVA